MIFKNIRQIFSSRKYLYAFILLVGLFGLLWWYFTDIELMIGNYGMFHIWFDSILSWITILGFSLFIVAWTFRAYTFGGGGQNSEKIGFLGGIIGILISGSLCCGASLLIPLGLSAFTSFFYKFFPYGGLELKFIGVIILLIGLYMVLKNLTTCKRKNKKSR